MDDKTFFTYYIPALDKSLSEDHINYGFMIKSPHWWYPENLSDALEKFEDTHYDEFPILEKVAYYFDAKGHGFSDIEGMNFDDYKQMIKREVSDLKEKYNFSNIACYPKREMLKANILQGKELMIEFPEEKKDHYVNIILKNLDKINSLSEKYFIKELNKEYIILNKDNNVSGWDLGKIGLPLDIVVEK